MDLVEDSRTGPALPLWPAPRGGQWQAQQKNLTRDGWRVSLGLPGGASISSLWNAVAGGTSGAVTVTNQSYNGRPAAAHSATFGVQGTENHSGATVTCAGS